MKIILTTEELDELTDDHRAQVTSEGGEHTLEADSGIFYSDDVTGLKAALKNERQFRRDAEKKAKDNPDIEALETELQSLKEKYVGIDPDEVKAKDAKIAKLEGERNELKSGAAISEAIGKHNGNAALLTDIVANRVKVIDGEIRVYTKGGEPAVDAEGKNLSVDALVESMSKDASYSSVFAGTTMSGSGSEPSKGGEGNKNANGGNGSTYPSRRSEFSERQAVDYQKQHGLDALLSLPQ